MRIMRRIGGGTVVAALLLTAGCGSSSSHSSASAAPVSSASTKAGSGFAAYSACLKQHGVTIPTTRPTGRPSPGASGRRGGFGFGGESNQPAFKAAQQACQSLMPKGGRNGSQGLQALQAFSTCLKSHGVVIPTPSPGARNGRGGFLGGLNQKDAKVAAAVKICRPLMPTRNSPPPAAS
jgi:hypothetical protein